MQSQLLLVVPIFPSCNYDRKVQFYVQFGYRQVGRHAVGYLILRKDGVEVHFNAALADHDPYQNRHTA